MSVESLFTPVRVGAVSLSHRIVMPPLTRMRSRQPGDVPQPMNAQYYAQRATRGGLIIAEATDVSEQARGYPGAPGIYSAEQVQGWRLVTDAVHAKGGVIFALAKQFGTPIRYIGVGEGIDDLRTFEADAFVKALFAQREDA